MKVIVSDDELLYLYQNRSSEAVELLMYRYSGFIKSWIRKVTYRFVNKNIYEEMEQIAWQKFFYCLKTYTPSKGLFYTYVKTCEIRELQNYLQRYNEEGLITGYYPLEEDSENQQGLSPIKKISDESLISNPRRLYLHNESIEQVITNPNLSKLEKKVFCLKLFEYSYEEISKILDIPKKTVDNVLYSLRNKVR